LPHKAHSTINPLVASGAAAGILLLGEAADAHEIIPGVTGFPALMLHPFITQQWLGIVLTGLIAGRTRPFALWPFLVMFGASLVAAQLLFPAVPAVVLYLWPAAQLIVLAAAGAIAAFGQIAPVAAIPLFLLLAAVIGFDIQPEGPAVLDTVQATAATFLTGAILISAVGWLVSRPLPQWGDILIRVVAAWIAASALMVLAFLLR
jgi:hypothetical protein